MWKPTCARQPDQIREGLEVFCYATELFIAPTLNVRRRLVFFHVPVESLLVAPRNAQQLLVDIIDEATFFCTTRLERTGAWAWKIGYSGGGADSRAWWRGHNRLEEAAGLLSSNHFL